MEVEENGVRVVGWRKRGVEADGLLALVSKLRTSLDLQSYRTCKPRIYKNQVAAFQTKYSHIRRFRTAVRRISRGMLEGASARMGVIS